MLERDKLHPNRSSYQDQPQRIFRQTVPDDKMKELTKLFLMLQVFQKLLFFLERQGRARGTEERRDSWGGQVSSSVDGGEIDGFLANTCRFSQEFYIILVFFAEDRGMFFHEILLKADFGCVGHLFSGQRDNWAQAIVVVHNSFGKLLRALVDSSLGTVEGVVLMEGIDPGETQKSVVIKLLAHRSKLQLRVFDQKTHQTIINLSRIKLALLLIPIRILPSPTWPSSDLLLIVLTNIVQKVTRFFPTIIVLDSESRFYRKKSHKRHLFALPSCSLGFVFLKTVLAQMRQFCLAMSKMMSKEYDAIQKEDQQSPRSVQEKKELIHSHQKQLQLRHSGFLQKR